MINFVPPSCPECDKSLTSLHESHVFGGFLSSCSDCRAIYVVTRLPECRYAVVDATTGFWFENISKVDEVAIDLEFENQTVFERWLVGNRFEAAREIVDNCKSDLARMVREIAFFKALKASEIVPAELQTYVGSAVTFLMSTDPSTYLLPCDVVLPEGGYEMENVINYVPDKTTLVVFHSTLGVILQESFRVPTAEEVNKLVSASDANFLKRLNEPLFVDETFHRWHSVHHIFNLN